MLLPARWLLVVAPRMPLSVPVSMPLSVPAILPVHSSRMRPCSLCATPPTPPSEDSRVLRTGEGSLSCWGCVAKCGACCYLEPSERPMLDEWLDQDERAHYQTLVGSDGWCVHFDKVTRRCGIYETRPGFCRVDADKWQRELNIEPTELSGVARHACREWIGDVYGTTSEEMTRFDEEMCALNGGTAPDDPWNDPELEAEQYIDLTAADDADANQMDDQPEGKP